MLLFLCFESEIHEPMDPITSDVIISQRYWALHYWGGGGANNNQKNSFMYDSLQQFLWRLSYIQSHTIIIIVENKLWDCSLLLLSRVTCNILLSFPEHQSEYEAEESTNDDSPSIDVWHNHNRQQWVFYLGDWSTISWQTFWPQIYHWLSFDKC